MAKAAKAKWPYNTGAGQVRLGDSLEVLADIEDGAVNLVMTSPPFGLVREKGYGNVSADKYIEWFKPFGKMFHRLLAPNGSLVIDIGGAWIPKQPTRSLYHYELLISLCRECGFHLAQDLYWWNPAKLPTPAEWVNVRRLRVKDAVNCVWWLSPTPWPKASNTRVLVPYSNSMRKLLARQSYNSGTRPSGHDIGRESFSTDNKAAIPPNLIAAANTESNSRYQRYCKQEGLSAHPARFPAELPEFFVRMLTDPGDLVIDPFAGSCVTGEVSERLGRRWICVDTEEDYLKGALARFDPGLLAEESQKKSGKHAKKSTEYKLFNPAALWTDDPLPPLDADGGKNRSRRRSPACPGIRSEHDISENG